MKRFFLPVSLLLMLAAAPALATTMVLGTDAELYDQADAVVEGTVLAAGSSPSGRPATEYRVRVERAFKGQAAGELTLSVPGGEGEDGRVLMVWGAPELQAGERALLFLVRRADGRFGALHLAMGVFHEVRDGGRTFALRDLSEMEDVSTEKADPDRPRDFERFAGWLADRAAGLRRTADYFVAEPVAPGLRPMPGKFTYLAGLKQRWIQFAQGTSIGWRAHSSGQPDLAGGGFSQFQTAMQAWSNDPATTIRYHYDGTTTLTGGLTNFDDVNVIVFEDPNEEVDGTFFCSSPGNGFGVLALGGTWIFPDDPEPIQIHGADIVINNGAGCWFSSGKRAEQVYGHELGHTLGLGHSCGDVLSGACNTSRKDQALMRATAFADERGASLNADDLAGILSLYRAAGAQSGKPAAPTNLTAVAVSATSVDLDWVDRANNETSIGVEMKTGGGAFQEILSLPADSAAATISNVTPETTYTFRVRARNNKGSSISNEATVTTPASIPAAPTDLTATLATATEIRLDWSDNSSNETGFRVEGSSPATGWTLLATLPAGTETFTAIGEADTPYSFRVRATGAGGSSAFSNVASLTTPGAAAGPCVPGAENLCLLSNRFRVTVRWRQAGGTNGAGKAIPDSDQTGLFWFFGATNIELIVKMLDASGATGSFWVYYGGLSDVEYWVSVADTQTGATRTYHNEPGNLCGNGDVNAFPAPIVAAPSRVAETAAEPAVTAVTGGSCAPGALCLFGGRFQVEVSWRLPDGTNGTGTPVPLAGTDESGLFWFFGADNKELVVKVIDARSLTGTFWFYYGALSDVEYDIKVTDATNEATKIYHNAPGNLCGKGDVEAFE